MKNLVKIAAAILFLLIGLNSHAQELDDIVKEVSEAIELDETQTKALETEMGKFAISLQLIFDKYEEAEPDPQAMLTDIKHAREAYQKALKGDIGKEKYKAYETYVDKVILEVLGEAAGLRLMDVQDPLKMTDEQLLAMKPILAKAMKGIMSTLMQYIDKPMNVRNKLKIGSSLKSIKKTLDKETATVLTQEQISKWNEMKEAAKEDK
jgi:hypothetical protein